MAMAETKVIYHLDEEDTPYLMKLPLPTDRVTLLDLKNALNRPNYKYFFKSMDDDFGVVKEEIVDDRSILPCYNGRIVTWLVLSEGSVSDTQSQCAGNEVEGGSGKGGGADSVQSNQHISSSSSIQDKPTSHVLPYATSTNMTKKSTMKSEVEKSNLCEQQRTVSSSRDAVPTVTQIRNGYSRHPAGGHRSHLALRGAGASSVMSSDIETTSFVDSEFDASSRLSTTTETTNQSSYFGGRARKRRKHRLPVMSRASSFSSVTDSTMSLNIVTVQLNMESASFLGISIVGQSNKCGDGGIYVGSIMKGGAVAQDGRIEPGDMILEVNGVSFENMSNDDAVRTLREAVQRPGPITLVVAKCWDPNPKGYLTIPRQEPIRPIDPSAWVMHTEAVRQGTSVAGYPGWGGGGGGGGGGNWGRIGGAPSFSTLTSTSTSLISSVPPANDYMRRPQHSSATSSSSHSSRSYTELNLTKHTDMAAVVRAMARPDSGLEVRDRMWLKIAIPHSFIGSELVDWLHTRVDGFIDRRDARRYACNLLKAGFIQHTVNKLNFSEQCYYVFGNDATKYTADELASMSIDDIDSVSSVGQNREQRDTLSALPAAPVWNLPPHPNRPYQPLYMPSQQQRPNYAPPMNYAPPSNYAPPTPYAMNGDSSSYISMPGINGAESVISGSGKRDQSCACIVSHTYKQIRRLWDNPDKNGGPGGNHATQMKMIGKFDADIDRSTSSDTGSSDSESSQDKERKEMRQIPATSGTKHGEGGKGPTTADGALPGGGVAGGAKRATSERGPPPPPPPRDLSLTNHELDGSRQSFRMAMGNTMTDDTLQVMGDL